MWECCNHWSIFIRAGYQGLVLNCGSGWDPNVFELGEICQLLSLSQLTIQDSYFLESVKLVISFTVSFWYTHEYGCVYDLVTKLQVGLFIFWRELSPLKAEHTCCKGRVSLIQLCILSSLDMASRVAKNFIFISLVVGHMGTRTDQKFFWQLYKLELIF